MLVCLSANHRSADFTVLEKLSTVERGDLDAALAHAPGVLGAVTLATCNRFEVYVDLVDGVDAERLLLPAIARVTGLDVATLREQLAIVPDDRVPEYLFAVSSGLESVVVGEGEIAGQVRRSLESARAAGLTTSALEQLFQRASQASKGVQHGTTLQRAGRSLVRFALELASSNVPDWTEAKVLVVGTGNYAGATLKALRDLGVTRLAVHSPSGRAHRFAEREGIHAVHPASFLESVANADVVVTCSNAPEPVLEAEELRRARRAPGAAVSTLVIDLGMPRNVDPLVGGVDDVDLLDLETIRMHAPLDELGVAEEARCIVARAANDFRADRAEAELHHGIAALRRHVTELTEHEVARSGSRLGEPGEIALRRLANTILHEPSVRAKELARQGRGHEYLAAIELLFGLRAPELEPGAAETDAAAVCPHLASIRAQDPEPAS